LKKEIVAFTILTCLLLASAQTVLADGCYSTTSVYGPFIAPGSGSKSLSPFDATFIHVREASVTLSSEGIYTFEIRVASTPGDWMEWTTTSPPTFAAPHEHTQLSVVAYRWFLRDASGHFLGLLHYAWLAGGTLELLVIICPPSANLGCLASVGLGAGTGYQIYYPTDLKSLTATFNHGSNTVTLTISQSDLNNLFTGLFPPTQQPAEWQGLAAACHRAAPTGEDCTGYVTYPPTTLPT
jgi:hypothetical protein